MSSLIKALTDKWVNNLVNETTAPFKSLYKEAGEGGTPSTSIASYYDGGDIPFIKIDDLSSKYLTENKDFITKLGMKKSSAWLVPANSVIYSNGATIGAISINTYPVCTKQGILGIVPSESIMVEFLYYMMSSSYFSKQVQRIVTEGTMKTAYLKDINTIPCPLPDTAIQRKMTSGLILLSERLALETYVREYYRTAKQHLLNQLFI